MSKIVIASDSTTDLSPELIERYGIKILPLTITLGGKPYLDGQEITADDIYDYYEKTGELPKTTAANVGEYIDFFAELKKDADAVLFFSLCSLMSSTFNNARIAAQDFENVFVVDTMNLSTGGGLLVISACDMAEKGLEAEEIFNKLNELSPCVDASFVIDSLEFLHKGGRCSALSVLGANLLKLKPCIEVKHGVMGVGKKYRGKFTDITKEYVKERLSCLESIDKTRIFFTHAGCDSELVKDITKMITDLDYFDEVLVTRAGSTVSSHCGRNCLGVLFIRKSPIE